MFVLQTVALSGSQKKTYKAKCINCFIPLLSLTISRICSEAKGPIICTVTTRKRSKVKIRYGKI
jgi:hypothetical protein